MKSTLRCSCLIFLASIYLADAQAITVPNGSFESPSGDQVNPIGTNTVSDFTFSASNGYSGTQLISEQGFASTGTSSGAMFAFLNLDSTGSTGSITYSGPSLGTIMANTTYTLTVALGNPAGADSSGYGAPGNETIALTANGTPFTSKTVLGANIPDSTFTDYSTIFTTGALGVDPLVGNPLGLVLSSVDTSTLPAQSDFDNIRLTAVSAAPEPSTYALLSLGLGFLVLMNVRQVRARA